MKISNYEQNIIDFYNYQIERLGDNFLIVQGNCLREEIKEFEEAYQNLNNAFNEEKAKGDNCRSEELIEAELSDSLLIDLEKEYADVNFCVTMISYHLNKKVPPPHRLYGAIKEIAEDNMNKVRMKQEQGGDREGGKLVVAGFNKEAVKDSVYDYITDVLGFSQRDWTEIYAHGYMHRADHLNMVVTTIKSAFNLS